MTLSYTSLHGLILTSAVWKALSSHIGPADASGTCPLSIQPHRHATCRQYFVAFYLLVRAGDIFIKNLARRGLCLTTHYSLSMPMQLHTRTAHSTHTLSTWSQPKCGHHAGVIPSSSHAEPVIFGLLNIPIMYGFLFDGNAGRISRLVRLETILVHLEPSSHLGSK